LQVIVQDPEYLDIQRAARWRHIEFEGAAPNKLVAVISIEDYH
jgi:hypothetical protein